MYIYKKCWFDLFKEQFISLLNFGQNYFVQLRWNWFSTCIMNLNAEEKLFGKVIYSLGYVRLLTFSFYWLDDRVTWDIVSHRKPMSTEASPQSTLVFSGWQFLKLPSCAVNIYMIWIFFRRSMFFVGVRLFLKGH